MKLLLRVLSITVLLTIAMMTLARRDFAGAWTAYTAGSERDPRLFLNTGDGISMQSNWQNQVSMLDMQRSPDGNWVAFLAGYDARHLHIYRARSDARAIQRLSMNSGSRFGLAWVDDNQGLRYGEEFGESYRIDDRTLSAFGPDIHTEPRYLPIAAPGWHPLPLTIVALGMLLAPLLWKRRS